MKKSGKTPWNAGYQQTPNKMKRQLIGWEKVFVNHISDEELISKTSGLQILLLIL